MSGSLSRIGLVLTLVGEAALALAGAGCKAHEQGAEMTSPFPRSMTLAVAPVLNFSGHFDLDPIAAADLLVSELGGIEGVSVLPVNRVVAVLAMEGKQQIESPSHALAVAEAVGADAILVPAITEYDPYTPVVGLALQMYSRPRPSAPALDPVAAARQARPLSITEMTDPLRPADQVQAVYNGMHREVVEAVRRYAKSRSEDNNPFEWRQYLKVQSLYLRFCWHETIDRLMDSERARQAILADGPSLEVP
jgi:hypothetical protein